MNKIKIALIAIISIIVITVAVIIYLGLKPAPGSKKQPVTLEFWGVFDDKDIMDGLIKKFQKENPSIIVNYKKKSFADYETELVEALAENRGPDVFSIHNTWLPKHKDKIQPVPNGMINITEYNDTFVPTVSDDFIDDGKIYAIPLYVDTLALYYNRDMLLTSGLTGPPKTWKEFNDYVITLTRKDRTGNIVRAGAAIGTAENINRSTDILTLLMMQSGARMISEDGKEAAFADRIKIAGKEVSPGRKALQYYTDFANANKKVYTWNPRLHYSIDAFYEGTAAMMINYSHHIDTIKKKSPHLNFGVAPVPQIKDSSVDPKYIDVNYPSYWGYTVANDSKYAKEAWTFIAWLSQDENIKEYSTLTNRPVSIRSLYDWQIENPELKVFAKQGLTAKNWRQVDNIVVETEFAKMIKSINLGNKDYDTALKEAQDRISLLMRKKAK